MAQIETWLKCDLTKPVVVHPLSGNVFSADSMANLIGVRIFRAGVPAEISGAVHGYAIRADGQTVIMNGTLSRNSASVILPTSCYSIVGQLSIVIKVGTTTVGAVTGNVYRTTTETIVDPAHVIPSIDELLAQIAACERATTAANDAAMAANTAATETGQVNISMAKTGKIITVTTTNRNGQQTNKTIQEPVVTVSKAGSIITITATDADGTTSTTIVEPSIELRLMEENIPGTVQHIAYDSAGNIQSIQHKSGTTVVRSDVFTITDQQITEVRTLQSGEKLTIVTDMDTLQTTITFTAA